MSKKVHGCPYQRTENRRLEHVAKKEACCPVTCTKQPLQEKQSRKKHSTAKCKWYHRRRRNHIHRQPPTKKEFSEESLGTLLASMPMPTDIPGCLMVPVPPHALTPLSQITREEICLFHPEAEVKCFDRGCPTSTHHFGVLIVSR